MLDAKWGGLRQKRVHLIAVTRGHFQDAFCACVEVGGEVERELGGNSREDGGCRLLIEDAVCILNALHSSFEYRVVFF